MRNAAIATVTAKANVIKLKKKKRNFPTKNREVF